MAGIKQMGHSLKRRVAIGDSREEILKRLRKKVSWRILF
jgi:hypothetical protein